jgi:hypothetical protein
MVAATIEQVRKAFDDQKVAAAFAREFMAKYAATAFGVLPKTEIDLLVFSQLVQAKAIDPNGSIFRIARALNVSPTKAKGLLFQYQLRTMTEDDVDHAVMITLTTAKYRKEGDNLAFGVQSPLTYAAIRAKMQDGGVYADVSLSGDILRVSPEQFGKVIADLITPAQSRDLLKRLRKSKTVDETTLKAAIATVSTHLAKNAIEKGGETIVGETFKKLGELFEGVPGEVFNMLIDALG